MAEFRTNTHDAPEPRTSKPTKPGTIPSNKVGVYDAKGRLRGLVGTKATSATASRFSGTLDNTLGTKNGRTAWIANNKKRGGKHA